MKRYKISYCKFLSMEYIGSVIIEIEENESIYTYLKDDYYQDIIVSSCSMM